MRIRSLPHFSHKPIGKTTHKKGMSYQHVNYITRDDACSKTLAGNMAADRDGARPYFEREAGKEGVAANARIADTLIIALPLELTREQRHEAIERFMDKIGHGRIAWLAAFHDMGKDEHNPHCHLIFRDADIETGRKVVGTTTSSKDVKEAQEHGWKVPPRMTTKDLRVAWCNHLNAEMERHGLDVRFDQRRLKEQGIDREPQIHVGPKAKAMAERGKEFASRDKARGDHANVYSLIDATSRDEHNQRIIRLNEERAAAKAERDAEHRSRARSREAIEKQQLRDTHAAARKDMWAEQSHDRRALREAHHAQKLEHQKWARKLYAEAREKAFHEVKASQADRWARVREIASKERRSAAVEAIKVQQKQLYATTTAAQIEKVRPVKNEAWQTLKATQERERQALQARHREETTALARHHVAEQLAVAETWRAHHLARDAARIGKDARQDMASVQTNAVKQMKLHRKAHTIKGRDGLVAVPPNPTEAVKSYAETSRSAVAAREKIRATLRAERQENQILAGSPAKKRTKPGQHAEHRTAAVMGAASSKHFKQNKKETEAARVRPHSTRAGATFDACLRRLAMLPAAQARLQQLHGRAAVQTRHPAAETQKDLQQAVQSGRSLSSADRANASPLDKSEISSREARRARKERHFDLFVQRENSGKGRDGGGRSGR